MDRVVPFRHVRPAIPSRPALLEDLPSQLVRAVRPRRVRLGDPRVLAIQRLPGTPWNLPVPVDQAALEHRRVLAHLQRLVAPPAQLARQDQARVRNQPQA